MKHSPGSAAGFRAKLLFAMMLMIVAIVGAAIFFAQRNAESADAERLEREFQSEFSALRSVQDVRLAGGGRGSNLGHL